MKLLIITQKIDLDDYNLGFFHFWVEKFAGRLDKIFIISQSLGSYNLPKNTEVFSLGKEKKYSKIRQLFNFYIFLFKNIGKVDAVFIHMIPMWAVLGWPVFKLYRKRVFLWYVHKAVGFWLKIAEKIVVNIFTASKYSCRLESKKIIIIGHGIDVAAFQPRNQKLEISDRSRESSDKNQKFIILTAGRIAPVKNLDILIKTANILKNKNFNFEIRIAGRPILEKDKIYFENLKNSIREKGLDDEVIFVGGAPYKNIAEFYQSGNLFVNFSGTGSLDKVVLEAMASGLLVLTSNEAFRNILSQKYFTSNNYEEVAEKIIALSNSEKDERLREYVFKNHNLERLIDKLVKIFKNEQ